MDGMDGNEGMDGTDRRQSWNQDPPGNAQDRRDEQPGYQPAEASAPRETPAILPGRFLRNPAPPTPPTPRPTSMPPIPAEDAIPTRSVPVLSRPGYPPSLGSGGPTPSTPAPSAGGERAPATPGSGFAQGAASAPQPGAASALPRGAYVVEETQEMVVTPAAGPALPASSPTPSWSGAAQPGLVNPPDAAGASPIGYPQPEQTGSYSAEQPQAADRYSDVSPRSAGSRQNGIAASGSDIGAAWTGAGQALGQGAGEAQSSPWARQDQWHEVPAARAGGYVAASPAPAASGLYQQPGASGGSGSAPQLPQRARAAAPAQAGASLFGPAVDRGTVAIVLSANHAAAFSYLFGFLTGIFFYFGERENRYLRFHAFQSTALSLIMILVGLVVYLGAWLEHIKVNDPAWDLITFVGAVLVAIAMLVLWLVMMFKAWTGHYVRLPIISRYAEYFATPHDELVQDQGA